MLLGGVGLFLLGMRLMTDGLRLAAGHALETILANWTRTPLRGIGAGALITAIVQSSSAVTVATLGFVNARLLSLERAITVAYGSNLGTTMTGWLVVLVGFKINIQAFALPLIGLGMALQIGGDARKRSHYGQTLAGFGLFFLGIDVLQSTFAGTAAELHIGDLGLPFGQILIHVGLGALLSIITQSSSAAIAIVITAAMGQTLTLESAAAAVIGANLGTTSTALLGSIGATANTKRVALGHVAFNAVAALVALAIMPLLLAVVAWLSAALDLNPGIGTLLALFHTMFNLLGVLLMLPLTPRLVSWLHRCYRSREEDLQTPRYLDHAVLASPGLAAEALLTELEDIETLARATAIAALDGHTAGRLPEAEALRLRLAATLDFTDRLTVGGLPDAVKPALALAPWAMRSLQDAALLAERMAGSTPSGAVPPAMTAFIDQARALACQEGVEEDALTQLRSSYQQARLAVLATQESPAATARQALRWLDHIHRVHHLVRALIKSRLRLAQARQALAEPKAPAPTPALAADDLPLENGG